MEHRQSGADLVREREEVELGAELAVVALARLLDSMHVRIELVAGEPGRAVDALQLLVARVAPPVHAGDAQHADRIEPAGVGNVRPAAEVDEVAGAVDADRRHVAGQSIDDVDLEGLLHRREQFDRLGARELFLDERDLLCGHLAGALLDARQVIVHEVPPVGKAEVVEEPVLDRRPDVVLRTGEQLDHRGSHQVGSAVTKDVERGLGRCWKWRARLSGVVDDLVWHETPILRSPPGAPSNPERRKGQPVRRDIPEGTSSRARHNSLSCASGSKAAGWKSKRS